MDPGWLILFVLLMAEAACLAILTLPMPSNSIRGGLLTMVRTLWGSSNFVRYLTVALLGLNFFYFVNSISAIWGVESFGEKGIR